MLDPPCTDVLPHDRPRLYRTHWAEVIIIWSMVYRRRLHIDAFVEKRREKKGKGRKGKERKRRDTRKENILYK